MGSNYIITSKGDFVSEEELYHWGIKGMKWGIRRYQNEDGSLTAEGKKRYLNSDGTLNKKGKKKFGDSVKLDVVKKKTAKEMTDEELDKITFPVVVKPVEKKMNTTVLDRSKLRTLNLLLKTTS